MDIKLNMNAVNQILKSTIIYEENQPVTSIGLVLKGRILVQRNGINTIIGSGNFLGICDLYTGRHGVTYTAYDNAVVYVFPVDHKDSIEMILNANKDYSGLIVASLSKYMKEISGIHHALMKSAINIGDFLDKYYKLYKQLGTQSGYSINNVSVLEEFEPFDMESMVDPSKVEYYLSCNTVPLDLQKSFYGHSNTICMYHIEEQADIISTLLTECTQISCYVYEMSEGLINESPNCLFRSIAKLAMDLGRAGINNKKLIDILDDVIDKINEIETLFEQKVGRKLPVDREFMEKIYYELIAGSSNDKAESSTKDDNKEKDAIIEDELKGSLTQILTYANLPKEKSDLFKSLIDQFINLSDKTSTEDNARRLRKQIVDIYYELYELVFLRSYESKETSRIIDMFLCYGYLDERLLSKDSLRTLYNLSEREDGNGPCNVYSIKAWLTLIYEGKKEPSKSEFDMDYSEMVRQLKKSHQIKAEEEKDYLENPMRKLQYEIQNMFKYNNRITSGQISIFVPILYEDRLVSNIEKCHMTANEINAAVRRLLLIDFSIFARESLYVNEAKKIKKEYIVEEVFPDFIIFPNIGSNGVMWQDISGRKRNTSGRFLLPAFLETDLEDTLIKIFGRYRWEICRTIQGTAWNNIKYKSLTSEYSDYIQFYRKNRELSEERKEKLKMQIQKSRGSTREVFTSDYEIWIKSESQGAIRLNKQVRELLATYCPFSKVIRDKLKLQPLFEEAMARFYRDRNAKNRELDLRYRALQKDNIELTDELLATQRFYSEL